MDRSGCRCFVLGDTIVGLSAVPWFLSCILLVASRAVSVSTVIWRGINPVARGFKLEAVATVDCLKHMVSFSRPLSTLAMGLFHMKSFTVYAYKCPSKLKISPTTSPSTPQPQSTAYTHGLPPFHDTTYDQYYDKRVDSNHTDHERACNHASHISRGRNLQEDLRQPGRI